MNFPNCELASAFAILKFNHLMIVDILQIKLPKWALQLYPILIEFTIAISMQFSELFW
jgi:hypothetical protein